MMYWMILVLAFLALNGIEAAKKAKKTAVRCKGGEWDTRKVTDFAILEYLEMFDTVSGHDECKKECADDRNCYLALTTAEKDCYLASADSASICEDLAIGEVKDGSDEIVAKCSDDAPCTASFKICTTGDVKCSFLAMSESKCTDKPCGSISIHYPSYKVNLIANVFYDDNGKTAIRCPPYQGLNWTHHTWAAGGIRDYYIKIGPKESLEECKKSCEQRDDCDFAQITGQKNCYLLVTTSPAYCQYMTKGHFGNIVEPCSPQAPCPSAYKVCKKPNCYLNRIGMQHCITGDKQKAITTCTA